jgi:hypothetical protein
MQIQFHLIFDHHYDLNIYIFSLNIYNKEKNNNNKPICKIRSSTICLYE